MQMQQVKTTRKSHECFLMVGLMDCHCGAALGKSSVMADASGGVFGRDGNGSEMLHKTWSIWCIVVVMHFQKGELRLRS